MNLDNIPDELKVRRQWVGWCIEERDGKPTKPPYSPKTGGYASHAKPSDWATFEEAVAFWQRNPSVQGIGYVFSADDEYAGTDLDKCRNPETGEMTRTSGTIVAHLGSYTEVSPNKTGVHVIVKGTVPRGMKQNGVEIYDRLRYFTVTGDHVPGTPTTIEARQDELTELYEAYLPAAPEPVGERVEPQHVGLDDLELLEKIRTSKSRERFMALFDRGDWSGYESQSNADLALCSDLCWWTDRDEGRIDGLFRLSGLMRGKWDEKHFGDGRTYGQATIGLCVTGMASGYAAPENGTIIIDETEYRAFQAQPEEVAPEEPEYVCPAGGFIAAYVAYALRRTDAPPQAHELMAVGILSALAGPRPRLRIATHVNGWPLTIWTMYVVDSTVGRKSTVLSIAVDIVEAVLTPHAVMAWEGSPQGIIQRMQERDGQTVVFIRDEYSGLMQQMKSGHMAGLAQMFIRAYDGGVIENIRTKKRTNRRDIDGNTVYEKDTDRVENPYLVKLCASTRTALVDNCTIDDVISGFLPRFAIVSGKAIPRPMAIADEELPRVWGMIVQWARAFYEKAIKVDTVEIAPEVMEMQWGVEQAWLAMASDMARPDAGAPSLKRLSETVLKVAALIAIDECRVGDPVVTADHFGQAYRLGEKWLVSTMGVIEDLGSSAFMRNVDAYREYIYSHSGISKSDLLRKFRQIRQRDADEIIVTLLAREEVEERSVKNTLGPDKKVYYAYGSAPAGKRGNDGNAGKP